MTSEAKNIAKTRLLKRIGLIGLLSSGAIGLVFLVLSFLPQGNAAFTIRIDNPTQNANFKMYTNSNAGSDGKSDSTYLKADPMNKTKTTTAKEVEDYLGTFTEYEGSQNFVTEEKDHELAMVYTVYLANTSDTEDTSIKYAVSLDAYNQPENTSAAPIEYFRVLVQTEVDGEVNNRYYGHQRTMYPELPNQIDDDTREPISDRSKGRDSDGNEVLKSDFSSSGNDGYCINFNDYTLNKNIVDDEIVVKPNKVLRYTFVAYFEGMDLDCTGSAPENSYLLLSLHFGI